MAKSKASKAATSTDAPHQWRDRIVGHGHEAPDQLLANPQNWRVHSGLQEDAVEDALKGVGWVRSVLVNRTTGHVVDGHLRVALANKRGEPTVPVDYLELTVDEERVVLATLDPLGAMAGRDRDKLAELLGDLKQSETTESLLERLKIRAPVAPIPSSDEQAPVPTVVTVKRGDVYQLGAHRLMCGDSRSGQDRAALVGQVRPRLGLHDPPYGIAIVSAEGSKGGIGDGRQPGRAAAPRGKFRPIIGDDKPFDPAVALASADVVVLWGANHYADKLPASPSWIVWDKREDLPSNDFADCELAWVSLGGPARIIRHMWNGMIRASEMGEARIHPTQKPVAVQAEILATYAIRGDVVVDYFGGSGSTLMAAERQQCAARVMEIEPAYVQATIDRWELATGQKAVKIIAGVDTQS